MVRVRRSLRRTALAINIEMKHLSDVLCGWEQTTRICYVYLSDVSSLGCNYASVQDEIARNAWAHQSLASSKIHRAQHARVSRLRLEAPWIRSTMASHLQILLALLMVSSAKNFIKNASLWLRWCPGFPLDKLAGHYTL